MNTPGKIPPIVSPDGEVAALRPLTGIERAAAAETGPHAADDEDWRQEVASRVQNYRTRRHKYNPELCLPLQFQPTPFEEQRRANRSLITSVVPQLEEQEPEPCVPEETMAEEAAPVVVQETPAPPLPLRCVHPRKIIEFPRPAAMPRPLHYELAEPVLEQPRILEAAPEQFELLPAVPAITLDEEVAPAAAVGHEATPRFEAAGVTRRICCAIFDALILALALAGFAAAYWKIAGVMPPLRSRAAALAVAATLSVFWIGYHYCFLVWGGATAGMRLARIEPRSFDGEALTRRGRRRRALSMLVSLIAAGLGFAWTLLDDERLSWHDRISRSYLAPL